MTDKNKNKIQTAALITLLIIAYGLAIVGVLVMMFRRRHRWQDPESHWLRNYCATLVFLTLFSCTVALPPPHGMLCARPPLKLVAPTLIA